MSYTVMFAGGTPAFCTSCRSSARITSGGPGADYYAKFWHDHGVGGRAYGFPYDDVGGYSTYLSCARPAYLLVAVGW